MIEKTLLISISALVIGLIIGFIIGSVFIAMTHAKKVTKELKGLRLFADWAIDCDFGYDNLPEGVYEKYKEEVKEMRYTEALVYMAIQEANKNSEDK